MQPFFRAPSFENGEFCSYCGNAIRAGELVAELSDDDPMEYGHESCIEIAREDAMEAA
jgi:hypothetical protein